MKLFCTHDYKLFNLGEYRPFPFFLSFTCTTYDYVCRKCGKEKIIYSEALLAEVKDEERKLKKKMALGYNASELNEEEFISIKEHTDLDSICYRGKHIALIKQKYKKRGIDLDEINQM